MIKTVRLTMAQALIRFLEAQYLSFDGEEKPFVRGIFMLPGHGNVVGLGQAVQQECHRLELYQGKNEQGMAQAAMAFAKQSLRRQIFCCTSSVGPGAANMVTACANATANNIPLLVLPGDVYASRQPDPVLQQIEQTDSLSISTNDAFRPVCRYFDRINRPEQLMSAAISAFRVLTDPADTGAVCLALPQDVQGEAYDYPLSFFEKRLWYFERRPAAAEAVELAAARIRAAKRPLLICGGGVRYSGAQEAFRLFAERFSIPFGETQAGKSAVVWSHSLNLGGIGVTGCSAANELAHEADLIIGVGTRYTDFTTSSKWLFGEEAKFVNLNVSNFHVRKLDGFSVLADAREGLTALGEALEGYKADWGGRIEAARSAWDREYTRLAKETLTKGVPPEVKDANAQSAQAFAEQFGSVLCQTRAVALINEKIDADAVIVGASGSLPGDLQRMWRAHTAETYNMEYGYSCMGYEIAGALGAKLAVGEGREVYAMVGDGSFNMLHSELITAVQEGVKINVVLFDNESFGCINNLQVGQGNDTMCTELRFRGEGGRLSHGGRFVGVDYAGVAEAYGCKAYRIRTDEELVAALMDAKSETRPVLFDIKTPPKTMTEGYDSWWRVGSPEVSEREGVRAARRELEAHLTEARRY